MRSSYTALMQSKYFSPAFNSAIFDGPFRIYFAQFHESTALKVYLMLQQSLVEDLPFLKEYCKAQGKNILVMMYPTQDSFILSFEEEHIGQGMIMESWEDDVVIGLNGPLAEEKVPELIALIQQQISQWKPLFENNASAQITL